MAGPSQADLVVVGGGIVGASVALHAARAGAAVTLLDAATPAAGATGASFAWIRGAGAQADADAATPLWRVALEDWARLEREVPGVDVRWSGSLAWDAEPLRPAAGDRVVEAGEIRQLEPRLRAVPPRALWRPEDGAVDPVAVTRALLAAARSHGARTQPGDPVQALVTDGGGTVAGVRTAAGSVAARTMVLAAGAGTRGLCAAIGIDLPVHPSPSGLLRYRAEPGLLSRILATPWGDVRQAEDGTIVVAASDAEATRRRLQGLLGDEVELRLRGARTGARPMPADGLPVVGPLRGGYVAVMHAAISLAPVVGRLVADELVHGVARDELAGLRPGRFEPAP